MLEGIAGAGEAVGVGDGGDSAGGVVVGSGSVGEGDGDAGVLVLAAACGEAPGVDGADGEQAAKRTMKKTKTVERQLFDRIAASRYRFAIFA